VNNHYFSRQPTAARHPVELRLRIRGRDFAFHSDTGVFSAARIDPGTRLLAQVMEIGPADRVLDLGCGYGALGIVAASLAPRGLAVLVDRNQRAVELARANIAGNAVANAVVVLADGGAPLRERSFDVVVTNPPVHAGNQAVFAFIAAAHRVLRAGGRFYLVGRRSRGVLTFARRMEEIFGALEEVDKQSGYRVYCAQRQEATT